MIDAATLAGAGGPPGPWDDFDLQKLIAKDP